jgi:hypothetical protein
MKRICRSFALALGLPLGALSAQAGPALTAGARVRVNVPEADCTYPAVAPCYRTIVGALESIDSATILLQSEDGEAVSVSRAPSTRLEVNTRRGVCGGRRVGCMAVGLFGGAGLAALAVWIGVQSQGGASNCPDCVYGYFLVPPVAVVGMIVGAVLPGDHWERADTPVRLNVGPDRSGRFAVGLSLRF